MGPNCQFMSPQNEPEHFEREVRRTRRISAWKVQGPRVRIEAFRWFASRDAFAIWMLRDTSSVLKKGTEMAKKKLVRRAWTATDVAGVEIAGEEKDRGYKNLESIEANDWRNCGQGASIGRVTGYAGMNEGTAYTR